MSALRANHSHRLASLSDLMASVALEVLGEVRFAHRGLLAPKLGEGVQEPRGGSNTKLAMSKPIVVIASMLALLQAQHAEGYCRQE